MTAVPTSLPNVIVIRCLNFANLLAAILFRLLGRRTIFIHPIGSLRSEKTLNWLNRIGIELVDFHAFSALPANADLKISSRYAEAIMASRAMEAGLELGVKRIPGLHGEPDKARSLLFHQVIDLLSPYASAYTVAERFRDTGVTADVFDKNVFVHGMLKEAGATNIRNLHPAAICRFLSPVAVGIIWLIARLIGVREEESMVPNAGASRHGGRQVLFFPHQGLSYGKLFTKDQYFSSDPKSPLHPQNLTYIELAWMYSSEVRAEIEADYKARQLSAIFLSSAPGTRRSKLSAIRAYMRHLVGISRSWIWAIALARAETQTVSMRNAFETLPAAGVALIDSDNNFPRAAVVALQSLNIRVAALQERFITPFYRIFPPILDLYFVHGEVIKGQIASNKFANVGKTVVTGDPRVSQILALKKAARKERQRRFSDFQNVCLVLDFHSRGDFFDNAVAHGPDWKSNLYFYNAVADLAHAHPTCMFVIRGKDLNWTRLSVMAPVKSRFDLMDNVEIDNVYDRFDRSYELAAMADIVVARYTSLCDQCLAAGTPVLVLDDLPNGGDIISSWCDYRPYPVIADNVKTLNKRFDDFVLHGKYCGRDEMKKLQQDFYGLDRLVKATIPERLEHEFTGLIGSLGEPAPRPR